MMRKYLQTSFLISFLILSFDSFAQQSITVDAFLDLNGNGIDDGEPRIPGLGAGELILTDAGGIMYNFVETGPGVYTFDNAGAGLPDENYTLQYIETPWTPANITPGTGVFAITSLNSGGPTVDNDFDPVSGFSTTITLAGGSQMEMDVDLGLFVASSIGDFVWEDLNGNGLQDGGEPGIDGVNVSLLDAGGAPALDTDGIPVPPQVTMGGGMYLFGNLPPGDYRVEFSLPTAGAGPWFATAFDNTDPDFANDSDADPNNSFRSHIYTIVGNIVHNENIDAGFFVPVSIGNMVFCDRNGNGIFDPGGAFPEGGVADIRVQLIDAAGNIVNDVNGNPFNVATDGTGNYQFDLVPPGEYRVSFMFTAAVSNPPYVFTFQNDPNGLGDDTVDSDVFEGGPNFGQTDLFTVMSQDPQDFDMDAGVFKPFNLAGTVWLDMGMDNINTGELGPDAVIVQLLQNGVVIDNSLTVSGDYSFNNLPPGEGFEIHVVGTNFDPGRPLAGVQSCPGSAPADDMVDNDDNGSDTDPGDVVSTVFDLISDCDDNTPNEVNYVDFCFSFACDQPNQLASLVCQEITDLDIICDVATLGTFCAIMPTNDSPQPQPNPLCANGGTAHNITWFAFVAFDGVYDITLTPMGCTSVGGMAPGVQIGLYTDCTFTESVFCDPNCSTDAVTISSNVLEPGQVYYWFIDGCFGSVCSYQTTVTGSPIPPDLAPSDMCILNPDGSLVCDDTSEFCPDNDITFQVQGSDLTVEYSWEVITNFGGPFNGPQFQNTPDGELVVNFENEGTYDVCLTGISNGCQAWVGPICRTITVQNRDEEFDAQTLCDLALFDPSTLMPSDPNGDGLTGWQDPAFNFEIGTNTAQITAADGCIYEQTVELMLHPVSDVGLVEGTFCADDLPFAFDNFSFAEIDFGGNLELMVDDLLLVNEQDVNGCDSLVDVNLTLINIFDGELLSGICTPDGILLEFDFDTSLSTSDVDGIYTYEWLDPSGNVLNDDFDGGILPAIQDNIAPTGINGTYMLVISVEQNGVTCDFTYTVDIDFSSLLPSTPSIMSTTLDICESDSIQVYTAADIDADVFNYIWDITPGSATIVSGGGVNDDMVEINWAGETNGNISLIVVNGCGESMETEIDVTVLPLLTPDFDFTASVCQDSVANIMFNGDPSIVDDYTWNFDGGIINNGADPNSAGPFEIIWADGSVDRTVTLSLTHNGGCQSTTMENEIELVQPPVVPTMNCNPTTGEVIFSWDPVAGATGFDVIVISTDTNGDLHTGALDDTANTFTVTGLSDGETVLIQLVVLTGDACGMAIGQQMACTTQNCVAPTVELDAGAGQNMTLEICTDDIAGNITLVPIIVSGETGTGTFSGPGIIDGAAGTFDPSQANIGPNNILYNFESTDACIGVGNITIVINETPTAAFMVDTDTICVTEEFALTYTGTPSVNEINWTTSDNQSFNGMTPTVSFPSAGVYTISLVVESNGCESTSVERTVFVEPELLPINLRCSMQELTSVEFEWDDIVGATGYEVVVTLADGSVQPAFTTTMTSYMESGLTSGDVISIMVTPLTDSRCPAMSEDTSCEATACPTFNFTFTNPIIDVCALNDGSTALIDLDPTVSVDGGDGGGTFEWAGSPNIVNGNQFDPNGLQEGELQLFVTYTENGCTDNDILIIDITREPVASFAFDATPICVGTTLDLAFDGPMYDETSLDWSSSDVTVVAGAGPNDFTATFDQVGEISITLIVSNGDCPTDMITQMITVEEEIMTGDISCAEELEQITFSWDAIDCAAEYEIFIDGVSQGTQSETTFLEDGLTEGTEVQIEVLVISNCACPDVMFASLTCETRACVTVGLSLSAMGGQTDFCLEENLPMVEIIPEIMNATNEGMGTWSGTGVDANGMFDPNVAGVGTHEITFTFVEPEGCMDFVETITFNVFDNPTVMSDFVEIDCFDETMTTLNVTPDGGSGDYTITLNGNPGDVTNDVEAGSFDILVVDANGCEASESVTITVPAEPIPSITGATELIVGETSNYSIDPSVFAGVVIDSIVWTSNGNVVCNDASCTSLSNEAPTENTIYDVTIYFNSGCSVNTNIEVEVRVEEPITLVTLPNAISPNNDGTNDVWSIFTNDPEVVVNSVKIYDRFGGLMFTVDAPFTPFDQANSPSWDGKFENRDVVPGVYVYFVQYVQDGRDRMRSGDVTIVR